MVSFASLSQNTAGINQAQLQGKLASLQRESAAAGHLTPEQLAKMRAKATEFESFFIYQFINLMSPKENTSIDNGGVGEQMFRSKLQEEIANNIAHNGGFGLGNQVYAELVRHQSGQVQP